MVSGESSVRSLPMTLNKFFHGFILLMVLIGLSLLSAISFYFGVEDASRAHTYEGFG